MYDEGYSRPPSRSELAHAHVREHYAKFIERENLFGELEAAEEELANHKARFEAAKAAGAISDDQAYAVEEHFFYAEKDLKTTRLIIEQLDRAAKGQAYG